MAKVEINTERCKGCEYCVLVCPKNVLDMKNTLNSRGVRPAVVVDPEGCTGCALCAQMCPDVCIEVWK